MAEAIIQLSLQNERESRWKSWSVPYYCPLLLFYYYSSSSGNREFDELLNPSRSGSSSTTQQCPPDDNSCENAKSDARSRYNDLVNKRIPQYFSGGTRGSDVNHYNSIQEKQAALRDAIRRVRLYCKPLPPELVDWELVANQTIPKMF